MFYRSTQQSVQYQYRPAYPCQRIYGSAYELFDRHRLPPVAPICYICDMKHINKKVTYHEPCGIYKAICRENPAFEMTEDHRLIYHPELDTHR